MIMAGILGFMGLSAFLVLGLWWENVRERPVYERPPLLVHPFFRASFRALRGTLFLGGWFLAGRTFPRSTLLLAVLLLAAWAWRRYLRSRFHRRRMFRRAFEGERGRDPLATDHQVLQRILYSLHPRWGEELIEQIVKDNPSPEAVADMVVRMEHRSFSAGFSLLRILRRRA